jgi:NitT/TauT family transport system substrate-binding protein
MLKHDRQLTCRLTKSVLILTALLAAVLGSSSCLNQYAGKPDSITVGYQLHVGSTLIHIAENQGFFTANGLAVTFKEYESGAEAVNGLMRNEVDLSVASEFILVQHVLNKEEIRALASISQIGNTFVVVRGDRGIQSPADLKGRKIGIRPQASGRFYFGRFLELNGLNVQDVTVVDITAAEFVSAIVNGDVDAVVVYPPYIDQIQDRLGVRAVVWPIQNNQPGYSLLFGTGDWVGKHPQQVNRFLKALTQAEEYYAVHPDQAKSIVQKKLKYDDATMEAQWFGNHFSLSLDQSLILALEDESRWMIENQMTSETQVPDFLSHIYLDGLSAVKPDAVNIIR